MAIGLVLHVSRSICHISQPHLHFVEEVRNGTSQEEMAEPCYSEILILTKVLCKLRSQGDGIVRKGKQVMCS